MRALRGIAASPGIAIGPAFRFGRIETSVQRCTIGDAEAEWRRLQGALEQAKQELAQVRARAAAETGEESAGIFDAQALMLDDPDLLDAVHAAIHEHCTNAEWALHDVSESYARQLEGLEDEYLRARAADVRDVSERVLRLLSGGSASPTAGLTVPSVIFARDLTPSDTVLLDKALVLGFCTAEGGPTSHTAILARGLGLPAVLGVGAAALEVEAGVPVVLDGGAGEVFAGADEATVAAYQARRDAHDRERSAALAHAHEPAVTADGRTVEVVANIGNVAGAEAAVAAGAEGVGLLRTEFLYLERTDLPGEEEQYRAYRAIVDVFGQRPVVLRALDIGGDKELPYLELPHELNPFLGQRALRLTLAHPELLRPQLRAVLRAGAGRNLKLMFPMVATAAEIRAGRTAVDECRAELLQAGVPVAEKMQVGIMVEIPAAAVMADRLAPLVDFFSIGTNDLSQYTLAADRTNAHVADLADAFQPAVLRLIKGVIDAAHAHGKWCGLCGELAGEPLAIPILLGLGLDEFSMNPPAVPLAKQILRELSAEACRALALRALECDSADEVRALVRGAG